MRQSRVDAWRSGDYNLGPMTAVFRSSAIILPILAGPLRGCWWSPAAGGKVLRLFLGTYEPEQTAQFCQHIAPGDVVIDVGANAGYYTLLASRLVGPRGKVIALEPDPAIATHLRRHVRANRLANVRVFEAAVGAEVGVAHFSRGRGTGTGRLARSGDIEVRVTSLDELLHEHGARPTHLKIDVEGAELDVLRGGVKILASARPTIFLSTHGAGVHEACCRLLQEHGYNLSAIGPGVVTSSPELLAAA